MHCRKRLAGITCLSAGLLAGGATGKSPEHRVTPNILLVLADDLGWGDLSCFGNQKASTPNLDRVAAEGLRFDQFYVAASVCSPSRSGILTGQYPWRWRIFSYLDDHDRNLARGMADWLDPAAPSLAGFLQRAGYATGHFGKWHLGGQRDVGDAPMITEYGFDQTFTSFEGLGPRVLGLCYEEEGKPPTRRALGSDKLRRGPIEWMDRSKITGRFVKEAVAFMNNAAQQDRPFYINVWPDDVHSPFYPPLDSRGDGSRQALYRGVLEAMDRQLAPLFDAIRGNPALITNTIVLICSDNGPEPGAGSTGTFRGGKQTIYEGGVRSPLIVWAPGLMPDNKKGTWNRESVLSALDIVPSLLALAGVPAPEGVVFDGESLPETFIGRLTERRKGPLFFRLAPDGEKDKPQLAIRENQWKLLCRFGGLQPELYDLEADPGEKNNLSEKYSERVDDLKKRLISWNRSFPSP
jgi:uncharacterized sulfatase